MHGFINYAHRGASAYAPENTMEAFRLGVQMGANGIETDVRCTKDGILVLFHDESLDRVTNASGKLSSYTFEELRQFDVCFEEQKAKIPTLEAFLQAFSETDLQFAVELKQDFTEAAIIDLLRRYGVAERTTLTSFKMNCLMRARLCAPELKAGYLTNDVNDMTVRVAKVMGLSELCPQARLITPELVNTLHSEGFTVRPWGVGTPEQMRIAYDAGVDGMTVNFPDLLTEYHKRKSLGA